MRYIVFGGSGFVGTYTLQALKKAMLENRIENGEIIALDLNAPQDENVTFIKANITNDFAFEFKKSDVVIHLAARAYAPKPPLKAFNPHCLKEYFFSVNVEGTKRIIAKMLEAKCKNLIYFSTDMVYGVPQYLPIDTSHQRNPIGYYGMSKKLSEDIIINSRIANGGGLNATIFRPRMILGAGRYGILLKLFRLMELNMPLPLIGNGENCYQMVSVKDCAEAVICAIEKGIPNDEFNLGSQNPPCIKDLLTFVCKKSGSKSLIMPTWAYGVKFVLKVLEYCGIPLMYKEQYEIANKQYIIDITQTQKILGWNPTSNDKDMLFEAFEYYKQTYKN